MSDPIDEALLQQLLARKEGPKLDFKRDWYKLARPDHYTDLDQKEQAKWRELIKVQQDEFRKDVLALVHGRPGSYGEPGYLVIGVKDQPGTDGERELCDLGDLVLDQDKLLQKFGPTVCSPPLQALRCEKVPVQRGGGTVHVYVLEIPPSPCLHHLTREVITGSGSITNDGKVKKISTRNFPAGVVLIRQGETTAVAVPDQIVALKRERGVVPQPPTPAYDEKKVRDRLGELAILKPLTRWNEAYKEFPRFVMEYLVSRYVDADDPGKGQAKIDRILSEHYSESSKKELIKSNIKEHGEYRLLGQLSVRLDQGLDVYWASVPALGDDKVRISTRVLSDFRDDLLTTGAWGNMVVEYDASYEINRKKYPFYVREFTPFQVTRLDLDDFTAIRAQFHDEEWLDVLVQSIGFDPSRFERRTKLLMMLRLVPFVEANYNLIELGPRETGKTYTFRNTSNRSFVISGGKATPAVLFYNKGTRQLGVIGTSHIVFFDEIANTKFVDAEASVSVLKDYMQTGQFTRGGKAFTAECSIVLGGNIDTDIERREPEPRYSHLFEPLPPELQDTAFLDRIHAYLPGWEMPKIRPANYATGYGFMTDYLAEIFARLRRRNFHTHVAAQVSFPGMTGRNQDAITRTLAGLLKLLHPHHTPESLPSDALGSLLDLAVESRRRVTDQLAVMEPGEFKDVAYTCQTSV